MMTMLLIAGIAVLAAGLVAIGFGIPVKEFSFGNTLILAGAVAACTGVIMLGLSMVVRELRHIARRLGPANAAAASWTNGDQPIPVAGSGDRPSDDGRLSSRGKPAPANLDAADPAAKQPSPATLPWQDEAAARDRGRGRGDVPSEPAPPEPAAAKPRRNLLFSSSRKERERTLASRASDPAAADPAPVPPIPAPAEPPPATFEDAWPQSERGRSDALRRSRTPSTFAEPSAAPAAEPAPPAAHSEDRPPVTVLKSGVVDGMAYSLYSDGSIEAQMPEGMMRFASIDELRSHLDQRP
jgi:hypothetical protein